MADPDTARRGQVSTMKPAAATFQNSPASATGAILEADLQAHIGRQLRAVYEEVVNEGVPERFRRLLEELERKKTE
jgi:hypothetical protein